MGRLARVWAGGCTDRRDSASPVRRQRQLAGRPDPDRSAAFPARRPASRRHHHSPPRSRVSTARVSRTADRAPRRRTAGDCEREIRRVSASRRTARRVPTASNHASTAADGTGLVHQAARASGSPSDPGGRSRRRALVARAGLPPTSRTRSRPADCQAAGPGVERRWGRLPRCRVSAVRRHRRAGRAGGARGLDQPVARHGPGQRRRDDRQADTSIRLSAGQSAMRGRRAGCRRTPVPRLARPPAPLLPYLPCRVPGQTARPGEDLPPIQEHLPPHILTVR